MPTTLQASVNRYHKQGFCVLDILPNTKKPARAWLDFQQRCPTVAELRQWFDSPDKNVAIICGSVSGGLAILDIDDPRLAEAIAADIPLQAETTMVRTPRGGLHVYCIETGAESSSGPLIAGIADLKANGGYVLAPPSSIDAKEYAVLTDPTIKVVPNARAWAISVLAAFDVQVTVQDTGPERVDVAQTLTGVTQGERDTELFRLACKLRRADVPQEQAEQLILEAARNCSPPFSKREALSKVSNAYARYPAAPEQANAPGGFGAVVVRLSDVQREQVDWLWNGRLARGRLTCLMGDPGVGKSYILAAMANAISCGSPLPGQAGQSRPADVLILQAEDGLGDTLRPRLEDMGANLDRIHVWTAVRDLNGRERHPSIVEDLADIERYLVEHPVSLIAIDPINAYLGTGLDTHRDAALRGAITPLAAMCERTAAAGLFTLHLTKSARERAIYRGQGSIAYMATARVALLAGMDPDNERGLVCVKNNLAALPPSLGYEINEGQFTWLPGESSLTAAALLSPDASDAERSALDEARELLASLLAEGAVEFKEIEREAAQAGISKTTLRRAKKALGVVSDRHGFGASGEWLWRLPPKDATALGGSDTNQPKRANDLLGIL